jgi:adenine/guanine phosphoribosyltransferase-like PRPP-binding protein
LISESYVLAYGTDYFEMHLGAIEPGELDDLVATDGTLSAPIRLIREDVLPVILFSIKLKSSMRPC